MKTTHLNLKYSVLWLVVGLLSLESVYLLGAVLAGEPAEIRSGRSIILILDNSWSMRRDKKLEKAKAAAKNSLDRFTDRDEFALIVFSEEMADATTLLCPFTNDKVKIKKAISSTPVGKSTPLAAAICYAGNYLSSNSRGKENILIILTDGQEACDGNPYQEIMNLKSYQPRVEFKFETDAFEPNNTQEEAGQIEFGKTYSLSIYPGGDVDWFRFTVEQPGYIITLMEGAEYLRDAVTGDTSLRIRVFDTQGEKLDEFVDNFDRFKRFVEIKKPGEYFVKVESWLNYITKEPIGIYFDYLTKSEMENPGFASGAVKIYVIAFGVDKDEDALIESRLLAKAGGGEFSAVREEEELESAIAKVLASERTFGRMWLYLVILILVCILLIGIIFFKRKKGK